MGEIFERVIPAKPLQWTGERLTTATAGQVEIEHLHRYFLSRSLCRGLDVLDIASGEGYGTALLAQVARSVVGVDVSPEAVAHATEAYQGSNFRFVEGDACCLPLDDASVDAVVSFETIEHLYDHDQFLAEVRRVLRPGGRFIVSSPERDVYSPSGSSANPYHVRELSRAEFSALLCRSFAEVRLLGQRPILGSVLVSEGNGPGRTLSFEKRGPRHFEASDGLPRAVYLVAVASDAPVDNVLNSLYIETAEIGAVLTATDAAEAASSELPSLRTRLDAAEIGLASARNELALNIQQANEQAESYRQQLDAAEIGQTSARNELALNIQQANEQAESYRQQLDAAEIGHTSARNELALSIQQANEQAESYRQQLDAAEIGHASTRNELALSIQQANEQAESYRQQLDAAEIRYTSTRNELALSIQQANEQAESYRQQLDAAEIRYTSTRNELALSIQQANEQAESYRQQLDVAKAETAAACAQRDMARIAARRAAAACEGYWHNNIAGLQQQVVDWQRRADAAEQQVVDWQRRADAAEQQVVDWRQRYEGLRARLEAILRRFGIQRAARLFPAPARRFVRERLLGPRRQ